jgi:hypothetical protein
MEKLNVLLAKTDHMAAIFRGMVTDYVKFFSKSQGAFRGEKKTYEPRDQIIDQPNLRSNVLIQTTVNEKLEWFVDHAAQYIDAAFSVERTNAMTATATLEVAGKKWGEFTSLELLRLKSILENGDFHTLIKAIPVRSDAQVWDKSANPEYDGRAVWETPQLKGVAKTTEKESYILPDPNIDKIKGNYTPQIGIKNTVLELGDYTHQLFSGEISQRERAMMLARRDTLLLIVIEALKKCNECESEKSELNAKRVFGFIFKGQ